MKFKKLSIKTISIMALIVSLVFLSGSREPDLMKEIAKTVDIYPGSEVILLEQVEQQTNAYFETPSSSNEILEFYKAAMKEKGWAMTKESKINLDFSKRNMELMIEAVNSYEGKTFYTIYMVNV